MKTLIEYFISIFLLLFFLDNINCCQTRIPNRPTTDPFRYPNYLNPFNYPTLVPIRYRRSAEGVSKEADLLPACGQSSISPTANLYDQYFRTNKIEITEATSYSWPWVTGIYVVYENKPLYLCSGALIDSHHILTSAKCLAGISHSHLLVSLGTNKLVSHTNDPSLQLIDEIIIHEDYPDDLNDLAIVKLNKPVLFTETVRPVCLPSDSNSTRMFDKQVVITGW